MCHRRRKNDNGGQWTVPVGGGVGKLFKAAKLPINTQLQGIYNAETAGKSASDWSLRFQVQFLLPRFWRAEAALGRRRTL